MTDTIHPRFTLSFGTITAEEEWGRAREPRSAWLLDSTDAGWERRQFQQVAVPPRGPCQKGWPRPSCLWGGGCSV